MPASWRTKLADTLYGEGPAIPSGRYPCYNLLHSEAAVDEFLVVIDTSPEERAVDQTNLTLSESGSSQKN